MRVIEQGQFGVHLFFIISGFILALPFASQHLRADKVVSVGRYFRRRLTRLEPPYVIAALLCFAAALLFSLGGATTTLVRHLAASLGYVHTIAFNDHSRLSSPFWSLEVEVQFYALLPLLAIVFRVRDPRLRRGLLVLGAVGMALMQGIVVLGSRRLALTLAGNLQYFLAGLVLADIYVADWAQRPTRDKRWDLVSLFGWPLLIVGLLSGVEFQRLILPWVGVALFAAALRGPISSRILANRWIRTTGGMAYSIYLLHYPLMIGLGRTGLGGPGFFALSVGLALVVGTAFYALIERPCMEPDWPQRVRVATQGHTRRHGALPIDRRA